MYITRHIQDQIKKASATFPIVVVCGQRQVGKSTMLLKIKEPERRYVTMDDVAVRRLARTDPKLFLETYSAPLLIDEIQKAPEILEQIKIAVDEAGYQGLDNNGMFWITGSQKFHIMKNVSESLAGRVAVFDMGGLTQSELYAEPFVSFDASLDSLKKKTPRPSNVHDVFERIFKGSLPKPLTSDVDRELYYRSYVNTYLERDVSELAQVGKLDEFYSFLVYMAANTAQELKYETISKEIGVSAPTIKQWVAILERSGVIYILHPYYAKATKRLVKTPKVYFMDTGLAAYLTKWPNAETLEFGNAAGAFFETFVVTEIVRNRYNAGKEPDLYYYRDVDGKEIDLLIVENNKLYPIEIKKGKQPSNPTKNFDVLKKFEMDIQPALIMCMCDELTPLNRNTWYCPITLI